MRIAEHQHRQKASQAKEHAEHTGQPAGTEVLRQAVPKKGFHPPIQPGLAVRRRRRVRLVGGHIEGLRTSQSRQESPVAFAEVDFDEVIDRSGTGSGHTGVQFYEGSRRGRLERFPLDLTHMLRRAGVMPGIHVFAAAKKDVDGRDTRAFTPVFDGLCPAMTE
jgi:hypothetical protein